MAWRGGKKEGIQFKICGPTLHAHVPPGGRLLDSTTVILPGLVMSGVVLGLGHVAPELEIDLLRSVIKLESLVV